MSSANISIPIATLRKGVTMSALSALAMGSSALFVPSAYLAGVLPGTAVFLRFAIATIVLTLFLTLSGHWWLPTRQKIVLIFLLGFVGYSIMGTTFFVAFSLAPAWLVGLLTALYPLSVNVASWLFLKERPGLQQIFALLAVLAGGVLLFLQPFEPTAWLGILLMLLNIITVTIFVLVGQSWTRGVPPTISAFWTVSGASLGTLLYALFVDEFSFTFAPIGWLWVLCFGFISTAFAIMAMWWGIGLIGAARASIIGALEPLSAIILAVLFLGERLSLTQVIGGLFILVGMVLVQWQRE